MTSYRASGPKTVQYNELDTLIDRYYEHLRKNNQQQSEMFKTQIRKHVLTKGCSEEDLKPETENNLTNGGTPNGSSNQPMGALQRLDSLSHSPTDKLLKIGKALPTIRKVEDTLRGRLWRTMVGTPHLNCNDYQKQINEKEYVQTYVRLRGDTKRTFASSEEYMSRVSEERLVRVLNSYCQKYKKPYVQGMNVVAGGLLYVMPELDAFFTFCTIAEKHCPTYWYSDNTHRKDLSGAWAGSFLAWDILRVCDPEVWNHIKQIPPHMYLFPLIVGVQSIAKPFTELLRVWDFLFCFGLHLNPVLAAAQIIINRNNILRINSHRQLISTTLSQLKWMGGTLNAKKTVVCTMQLVVQLKSVDKFKDLWQQILTHASNFEVAQQIRLYHEQEVQKVAILGQGAIGNVTNSHLNAFGISPGVSVEQEHDENDRDNGADDDFDEFRGVGASLGVTAATKSPVSAPSTGNNSINNIPAGAAVAVAGAAGAANGAVAGATPQVGKNGKKGGKSNKIGSDDDSEESSENENVNDSGSKRRQKKH